VSPLPHPASSVPSEPDPRTEKAVSRFQSLAGSPTAEANPLVDALLLAAQDQLLETITGAGPVPSNMVAARAELLYYACQRAGRILEQREVEVLFRTLPANARAILAMMHATYEEALREYFLDRMRRGARVASAGTDATGLRWVITFSDGSNFQTAWDEIQRLGFGDDAIPNSRSRAVDIPQSATLDGTTIDTLDALGLARPSEV
jgi:hypothetical protein